jgi:mRNA interferase RelE/StbE
MYDVRFSDKALNQLEKLEKQLQERILKSLERLRIRPYDHVKRLIGINYFSFRVGNYRLILDIQKDKLIIMVIAIGPRKNIYDRI